MGSLWSVLGIMSNGRQVLLLVCMVGFCYAERIPPLLEQRAQELAQEVADRIKSKGIVQAATELKQGAWQQGALSLFIFDEKGSHLYDSALTDELWHIFSSLCTVEGESLFSVISHLPQTGGWVVFPWAHGYRHSFIVPVVVGNKRYTAGVGFFYETAQENAEYLVRRIMYEWPTEDTRTLFMRVSNPVGAYVLGMVYAIIIDDRNVCVAHGGDVRWIGQDMEIFKDERERVMVQVVRQKLESLKRPFWHEYTENYALKRVYCDHYVDPRTQRSYIIMAGYYPSIDRFFVEQAAKKVADELSQHGLHPFLEKYIYDHASFSRNLCPGEMQCVITDKEGLVIARSVQIPYQGTILEYVSPQLRSHVQARPAATPSGWYTLERHNTYGQRYAQEVKTADGASYMVIMGTFYPWSKKLRAECMVDYVCTYFETHTVAETASCFMQASRGIYGDCGVFVYDTEGYCWFDAREPRKTWMRDVGMTKLADGWSKDERGAVPVTVYMRSCTKQEGDVLHTYRVGARFYAEDAI